MKEKVKRPTARVKTVGRRGQESPEGTKEEQEEGGRSEVRMS